LFIIFIYYISNTFFKKKQPFRKNGIIEKKQKGPLKTNDQNYFKNYYRENKQKIDKQRKEYLLKNQEKKVLYDIDYYINNKENTAKKRNTPEAKEKRRIYNLQNKEKNSQMAKIRYLNRKNIL
jgi:hypothetical protein